MDSLLASNGGFARRDALVSGFWNEIGGFVEELVVEEAFGIAVAAPLLAEGFGRQ